MRPKIVALVIGIAFDAIVGVSLRRGRQSRLNDGSADTPSQAGRKYATVRIAGTPEKGHGTNASSSTAQPRDLTADTKTANLTNNKSGPSAKSSPSAQSQSHEEYVDQRVGELMDLGMTDDPEALKTLLSEIHNPEGEIRKAAIEAVKQFGSVDAIPKLEEA